jgi:hypothetical protein
MKEEEPASRNHLLHFLGDAMTQLKLDGLKEDIPIPIYHRGNERGFVFRLHACARWRVDRVALAENAKRRQGRRSSLEDPPPPLFFGCDASTPT